MLTTNIAFFGEAHAHDIMINIVLQKMTLCFTAKRNMNINNNPMNINMNLMNININLFLQIRLPRLLSFL